MEQSPNNWAGQNAQTSPLTAMWRLPKTFLNLERSQRIPWTAKDKAISLPGSEVLCPGRSSRSPEPWQMFCFSALDRHHLLSALSVIPLAECCVAMS